MSKLIGGGVLCFFTRQVPPWMAYSTPSHMKTKEEKSPRLKKEASVPYNPSQSDTPSLRPVLSAMRTSHGVVGLLETGLHGIFKTVLEVGEYR